MEIPISQDIRKFKTKDIGSFSFKEAGFLVLGAGLAFLTYQVFHCAIEVAIIPMGIVLVFGFFKPYGLTFTQFLRTVGKEKLSPTTYIYETDFEYNADEFEEYFEPFLKEGKDILHVCISSGISGTFNSANIAKTNLEENLKKCISYRIISIGHI